MAAYFVQKYIRRCVWLAGCSAFLVALPADTILQVTEPKFVPADGAQFGLHQLPASSPQADLVAFSSHSAALVADDTNNLPDIFVWSRSTGQVRLLSVGTNGAANGASFDPALSKDGRFVAFVSTASNFLPDTNKVEDVFLANVATGETELISVPQQTAARKLSSTRYATISEDGRYVAYASARTDLLASGTSTRDHVLIRDRVAGETIWANSTLETSVVTARPLALRESRLWFFSNTNLYQFDLATGGVKLFGKSSADPAFNSDGSRVALQVLSTSVNTVSWYDSATGETNVVFQSSINRSRVYHTLSMADTGAIAFMAAHPDDTNRTTDVYVALPGGDPAAPVWVSSIPTPADTTVAASGPIISPDGKRVYFKFTTISKLNFSRQSQLYLRDLSAPASELIATGSYFSKMIATPAGPLVLGGAGDFSFASGSDETDLALLLPPPSAPPEVSLRIGRVTQGWRISFQKIPNFTPKVQATDALDPAAWADTPIAPEDGGTEWIVTDPSTANQRFYRLLVSP
jgi:hypothetical protein